MTKFDDVNEAVNLLDNLKGSIENKIRTAFNLGYKQGVEDGKIEAIRSMYTWVFNETNAEQTEPSLVQDSPSLVKDLVEDEYQPYDDECFKCRHLKPQCEFVPSYCKYEPKTEPTTEDCSMVEDEDLGVPYVEVNGKDADCPWK